MYETAKIQRKLYTEKGMYMQVFVPAITKDFFDKAELNECGIWFNDSRCITVDQRKKIYALLADIAYYTGYTPDEMKQIMKIEFMKKKDKDYFSLKDCSLETAGEFIDYLIDFCLCENVPLSDLGINRTCNVNAFIVMCLKHKRCCICGKPADVHHEDAIGMGNDRRKVDDSMKRKTPLCRIHHTERHTIGEEAFNKKYHVYGVIYNEKGEMQDMVPLLEVVKIA